MTEELGRGIYLDTGFDFDITNTGDIRATTNGSRELQKDLAFQIKIIIGSYIGQPLTPNVRSAIKSDTIDTLLSDSRVEDLDRSNVRIEETGRNSLTVAAPVTTVEGQQELIFRV